MKKLVKRLIATILSSSCMFSAVAINGNAIALREVPEGYTEFDDNSWFTGNSNECRYYHKGNTAFIEENILPEYFYLAVSGSLKTKEDIAKYFADSDYFANYEITIGNPNLENPEYPTGVWFHSDKVSPENARGFYEKVKETGIKEPEKECFREFNFCSESSLMSCMYLSTSEDITDYFYSSTDEKDVSEILKQYVKENNLNFSVVTESCNPAKKIFTKEYDMRCHLIPNKKITIDEHFEVASKIKSDLGISVSMISPASTDVGGMESYSIDVLGSVDGDANEDGKMNMADVTAIVQAIGNPDKYALTPQGRFNADTDSDGITGMDALGIQMKVAEAGMPE